MKQNILASAQIKYHYDTISLNTSCCSREVAGRCLPLYAKLRSAPKHTRTHHPNTRRLALIAKHRGLRVPVWVFRGHFAYLGGFGAVTLPFTFFLF